MAWCGGGHAQAIDKGEKNCFQLRVTLRSPAHLCPFSTSDLHLALALGALQYKCGTERKVSLLQDNPKFILIPLSDESLSWIRVVKLKKGEKNHKTT